MNRSSETLHAPPRFLLWLMVVVFFVLIVGVLAGLSYFGGGERLGSLIPFAAVALAGVIAAAILGALIYRHSLPRLLWLWVTLASVVLVLLIGAGGIFAYKNVLPPRYQEEMLTDMPYMQVFLPPTPQGGIIPTVPPHAGDISPDQLLSLGSLDLTATVAAPTLAPTSAATEAPIIIAPPTATPMASPTLTPTALAATATDDPPPPEATQGASAAQQQAVAAVTHPSAARMYGFTYVRQGWNDCGPANITMALSHFGWRQTQDFAANILKPNPEDKNVSPSEMVNFVRTETEVSAVTRIGGDMDLLKDFIAANIPVIVETGYSLAGEDWLGHYQTVVGYDDNQSVFYIYDSWLGIGTDNAGLTEHYSDFDAHWQAFNRTFIALYTKDNEGVVEQILGDRADVTKADQHALAVAQDEARANPQNGFAWFNMGTAYDKLGQYQQAAAAYDQAFQLNLPFRMLWYQFGPFDAYFQTGRYDDVLALVNNNLNTAGVYVEETFYWQGEVYAAQGNKTEAIAAFQKAIAQNPNFQAARDALAGLS